MVHFQTISSISTLRKYQNVTFFSFVIKIPTLKLKFCNQYTLYPVLCCSFIVKVSPWVTYPGTVLILFWSILRLESLTELQISHKNFSGSYWKHTGIKPKTLTEPTNFRWIFTGKHRVNNFDRIFSSKFSLGRIWTGHWLGV